MQIQKVLLVPEADSGNAIAVVVVSSVAFICLVLLAGLLVSIFNDFIFICIYMCPKTTNRNFNDTYFWNILKQKVYYKNVKAIIVFKP